MRYNRRREYKMNGWYLIIGGALITVIGIPVPGFMGCLVSGLGGFCVGWGIVKVKNGT